jgi:hypothetical protein
VIRVELPSLDTNWPGNVTLVEVSVVTFIVTPEPSVTKEFPCFLFLKPHCFFSTGNGERQGRLSAFAGSP